MAWQLSMVELVEEVASARDQMGDHRSWMTLEALARGLRWVDELDESQRLFHDAAVDVIERPGRGAADSRARTAGFFALAGEPEASREWGVRAADEFLDGTWAARTLRHVTAELPLDEGPPNGI
jgi:hypothetical protein